MGELVYAMHCDLYWEGGDGWAFNRAWSDDDERFSCSRDKFWVLCTVPSFLYIPKYVDISVGALRMTASLFSIRENVRWKIYYYSLVKLTEAEYWQQVLAAESSSPSMTYLKYFDTYKASLLHPHHC